MLGIDPDTQRDRMAEALDVILWLFKGEKSRWSARLRRQAGKYDLSMICVAATNPFGYDALTANWTIANDIAAEQGRQMDAARLRLVSPMHIAETRAQAFDNVKFGFER